MDIPSSSNDGRWRRNAEKQAQERAVVRTFDIRGDEVTSVQHQCLIVERTRKTLRLISDEPLPVGERVDITFELRGYGGLTCSGIPRNLAVAYETSGYLIDVDLVQDHRAAVWHQQFH
jgi:hypothetical protein